MDDNELLFAISDMMDKKLKVELQPIKDDISEIKLAIESILKLSIQPLAENYVPAAKI